MNLPTCDFCNERTDEAKTYQEWTACGVCSRLIDAKRWQALLDYSVSSVIINRPQVLASIPESDIREGVRQQHEQFRKRVI